MTYGVEPGDRSPIEGDAPSPLPVIPPVAPPDLRLPYSKPKHQPLRYQVAQVFAVSACVTCGLGWAFELAWAYSPWAPAGLLGFVMMIATGGLVFLGDTAARPGPRPRALNYAIFGTMACLTYFTFVDFVRR